MSYTYKKIDIQPEATEDKEDSSLAIAIPRTFKTNPVLQRVCDQPDAQREKGNAQPLAYAEGLASFVGGLRHLVEFQDKASRKNQHQKDSGKQALPSTQTFPLIGSACKKS
jgi:hypothetical protein